MLSKVSSTLGLSSASIAASESEFSISSSSKSASPGGVSLPSSASSPFAPLARSLRSLLRSCAGAAALNGVAAAGAAGGGPGAARRRPAGHAWCRRPRLPGRQRVPVRSDHRRRLGVRTGIRGLEIDDVAQEDLALVKLVAPDDDGLEAERALAQPGDHGLAARLDALGDGDLALAREQLNRAHLAQVHAHGIVGALGRLLGLGLGRDLLLDFDQLAALGLRLLVRLLALAFLLGRFLGLDDVHPHLAEHGENVLDLLRIDLLRGQNRVDLVVGNVTALLGGADELLDGRIGQVEQGERRIWRFGCLFLRRLFLFFLFGRCLGLGRHASLLKRPLLGTSLTNQPSLPYAGRVELPSGPRPSGLATSA